MVLTWNHSKRGGSSMSTVVCRETWIKFFGFLPLQRRLGHHVFLACFAFHWMSLGFPSLSEWISHFDQARHYMHGALRWLGAWLFCVSVDSLDAIRCHNILAHSSSLAWHGNMKVHWNYLSVFLPVKHSCFLFRDDNFQRVGTNPIVLFSCKVRRPLCPVSALCPLQAGTWFVGNGTNCRCGQLWPTNGHGDQFRNKWDPWLCRQSRNIGFGESFRSIAKRWTCQHNFLFQSAMLSPAGNPISPNSWVENTKNSPMGLSENSEPSNPVVYHHFPIFSQ